MLSKEKMPIYPARPFGKGVKNLFLKFMNNYLYKTYNLHYKKEPNWSGGDIEVPDSGENIPRPSKLKVKESYVKVPGRLKKEIQKQYLVYEDGRKEWGNYYLDFLSALLEARPDISKKFMKELTKYVKLMNGATSMTGRARMRERYRQDNYGTVHFDGVITNLTGIEKSLGIDHLPREYRAHKFLKIINEHLEQCPEGKRRELADGYILEILKKNPYISLIQFSDELNWEPVMGKYRKE